MQPNPMVQAILEEIERDCKPCDHLHMDVGQGDCSFCYGGIEYCPECHIEVHLHDASCPENPYCPTPLAIRHWTLIPGRYRSLGGPNASDAFGVDLVPLRGGHYACYAGANGLTELGKKWIEDPYAIFDEIAEETGTKTSWSAWRVA